MKVRIVNDSPFSLPKYAKFGDAGMDVRADFSRVETIDDVPIIGNVYANGSVTPKGDFVITSIEMDPQSRVIIPTNLFVEVPEGYEMQVRPRSGISFKKGLTILNSPGTIDHGYRGNVGIICANYTNRQIVIKQGERIAQLVLNKFESIEWEPVLFLTESERGVNGFGHSGSK